MAEPLPGADNGVEKPDFTLLIVGVVLFKQKLNPVTINAPVWLGVTLPG
jgi:hypothetical protein